MGEKRKHSFENDEDMGLDVDAISINTIDSHVPSILDGRLFEIQELKPDKKVSAICCICKKLDKIVVLHGFLNVTSNFIRHYQVSSNKFLKYLILI